MLLLAAAGLVLPHVNWSALIPELVLIGMSLVFITAVALTRATIPVAVWAAGTVAAGLTSGVWSYLLWHHVLHHGAYSAVSGALDVDGFSSLFLILISVSVVLYGLVAGEWCRREGVQGPEFFTLALLSASGAMFMAAANDLLVIFLGIEILSIALYVLVGLNRRRQESGEASMKYFILGAFSSALLLYGIALVYGSTGSTNLARIATYLSSNIPSPDGLLLSGVFLIIAGLAFKVAAVPFHFWTPDVYQGAPSPVTGFMAAVAKAGGFAALIRILVSGFPTLRNDWQPAIWLLAVLTLVVGAVLAVVQNDVKRMLAYSSVSHAGFVLVGLEAGTAAGVSGAEYYLLAYMFLIIGSFGLVSFVGGRGDVDQDISLYRGLAARQPYVASILTVLLLAQAGVPFTTGFLAKFYVILAAVQARSYSLAVIAMVAAVIAAFFYLRVVFAMYSPAALRSEAGPAGGQPSLAATETSGAGAGVWAGLSGSGATATAVARRPVGAAQRAVAARGGSAMTVPAGIALAAAICVGFTIVLGIWPSPMIDFADKAVLFF